MNTVKELRKEKKLTQSELATIIGIDQTTVSKWELNKALPDTATLIKLSEFFDVSIDYLLSRSNFFYPDYLKQKGISNSVENAMRDTYSSEERKIIEQYRSLPKQLKKLVRDQLEVYCAPNELLSNTDKKV